MDLAPDLHEFGWCPFAAVIGRPCILCGGTRAAMAVIRGDLVAAWNFNASVVVLGAIGLVVATADLLRGGPTAVRTRFSTLTGQRVGGGASTARMVACFVVWWAWNLARW